MDFEALGHFRGAGRFLIDPIYKRAMFVHKDGKRLFITYWCNVCYIRTYTPGNCRCCQKYTDLDLTENDGQQGVYSSPGFLHQGAQCADGLSRRGDHGYPQLRRM